MYKAIAFSILVSTGSSEGVHKLPEIISFETGSYLIGMVRHLQTVLV